jgi:PUA-domain protein
MLKSCSTQNLCSTLRIVLAVVADIPKKRRRYFLREKEAKRFLLEVSERLGTDAEQFLGSKTRVEVNEIENAELFIFNGKTLLARSNGEIFPMLSFEEFFSVIPRIVVDMGAVPYVCKGADVMAPGVRAIKGEFKENALILVIDERHGKPLAVGVALFSSEDMKAVKGGKTVKNLHYVGDKLWNHTKAS